MDPEVWRWIWLVAAATFIVGEIAMTGAFFLLPFGVGAAAATGVAFTGVNATWQWLAFVLVSVAAFAAVRPMARRMKRGGNQPDPAPDLGIHQTSPRDVSQQRTTEQAGGRFGPGGGRYRSNSCPPFLLTSRCVS